MMVNLVPFSSQLQTEFFVFSVRDEEDPLVETVKVSASTSVVKVTIEATVALTSVWFDDSPARIVVAFNSMLATFALS